MGFLLLASAAHGADSVFVDGAFNGNWFVTFPETGTTGTITFSQIPAANGPALIDSFNAPGFAADFCPAATQKREFYVADFAFAGGGRVYACTNGGSLVGRYRDTSGANLGTIEIDQTNSGSNPPSWSGVYVQDSSPDTIRLWRAAYQGGGIATPLAEVPDDELTLISATPQGGSAIGAGSIQDFTALVEYKVNAHLQATVRLVLSDSRLVRIAESAPITAQLSDPKRQAQLQIQQVQIPTNATLLFLRAEMVLSNGQASASTPQVSYSVDSSPAMQSVAPEILSFSAGIANPGTLTQTVLVQKTGAGASLSFTASRVTSSPWLSVAPSLGQATNTTPGQLTVTVNTQGLAVGTLVGGIRVSSALETVDIPVTVVIKPPGPTLSLNKTGIRFEVRQGQGFSAGTPVSVLNVGDPGSVVNWSVRVTNGASLLNLSPSTGTSTVTNPSAFTVALSSTATNTLGPSYAVIEVTDPNARNSPQFVTVVVDVQGPNTPPVPLLSTAGFFLTGGSGGAQPAPRTFAVNVSQTSTAPFLVTTTTDDGRAWLSANPASGSATTANPGQVTVGVSTVGLSPGVYRGAVNVRIGAAVRAVKVVLVVQPAAGSGAQVRAADGCTPKQTVVLETNLVANFAVPAGWPAALLAQLYDDCGTELPSGSVVATFSNGDAPLSLLGDRQRNEFAATWQPGTPLARTVVTLTGTFGALQPDKLQITGDVSANNALPPRLTPSGLIHNLNPQLGAPLAPGTVAQVYGERLATAAQSAPSVPLPTRLGGVEMVVGGLNAPLYYVSDKQLTVQIPSELQPNRTYQVLVSLNGAFSVPEPLNLVPIQPGTVAFADGRLVAQHGDFQLVTPQNPARPGELLVIYLVGMGATDQAVASGMASPGNPLARVTAQPQVTIDGQNAEIIFAGLTPGGVGLYQINLRVPANARSGEVEVVITQGDATANLTRLVVAR